MVDTLVSGASASRRVGSTPISGTKVRQKCRTFFFFIYICGNDDLHWIVSINEIDLVL